MAELIFATHPEVVLTSARAYRDDLTRKLSSGNFSEGVAAAVGRLCALLDQVQQSPAVPNVSESGFTSQDLAGATPRDVALLINECTLGWGRDDAPVVVMGTEEAYSATRPADLALWNCCCSVIWACGGDPEVVAAIDPRYPEVVCDRSIPRRVFHVHANDYFRVEEPHIEEGVRRRAGRHTWKVLAQVIGGRGEERTYLAEGTGRLGDLAYQIEVSAYPSTVTAGGKPPTEERHLFLVELVKTLSSSARVLLFHGRADAPQWGHRGDLARAFLGFDPAIALDWKYESYGNQAVHYIASGDRLVILTRAMNGAVRGDLIDRLHELVSREIENGSLGDFAAGFTERHRKDLAELADL